MWKLMWLFSVLADIQGCLRAWSASTTRPGGSRTYDRPFWTSRSASCAIQGHGLVGEACVPASPAYDVRCSYSTHCAISSWSCVVRGCRCPPLPPGGLPRNPSIPWTRRHRWTRRAVWAPPWTLPISPTMALPGPAPPCPWTLIRATWAPTWLAIGPQHRAIPPHRMTHSWRCRELTAQYWRVPQCTVAWVIPVVLPLPWPPGRLMSQPPPVCSARVTLNPCWVVRRYMACPPVTSWMGGSHL